MAEEARESRLWEAELALRCFRVAYLGDANKATYDRICELRKIVRSDKFYSVYGAFIQASGTGKTRAVLEMSQLGVYICYCSSADPESSACPPRTRALADKLSGISTEVEAVLYLKAWMQVLNTYLSSGTSASTWMQLQLDGVSIATEVADVWSGLLAEKITEQPGVDRDSKNVALLKEEMTNVLSTLAQLRNHGDSDMTDFDMMDWDGSDDGKNNQQVWVVFVFDEARGLLVDSKGLPVDPSDRDKIRETPFYNVRRALRVFFDYEHFFGLVLDTDSKMSNLLPADDNSGRARPFGINLLPPIYYLPTTSLHVPKPGLSVEEYTDPSTWLRYGRPMWAARLDSDNSDAKCRNVLQLAGKKLVRTLEGKFQGQQVDVLAGNMTESQALAMLGAAAGLEICPRSVLAQTMTASHMSIVLRVTKDRSMMFVTLPPEPILSEAAADYLSSSETVQVKALTHMIHACKQGYVTAGPRGEFVAKYILVAAMWSLKKDHYCLRPVTVDAYLKRLLFNTRQDRATYLKLQERLKLLKDGIVFFNSFVVVRKPPTAAMLQRCWASGHAIMYRAENNLPGSDMVIPVHTPAGMSGIVISVKNLQGSGWLEKVSVEKLKCEFTQIEVADNLPVVTIAMSLREPAVRNTTNWLLWEEPEAGPSERHVHLTCYGISGNYAFLPKAVRDLLRKVLVTVPDPRDGCTEVEKKWIEGMLPDMSRF